MADIISEGEAAEAVNPFVDKGNYLVQIKVDDQVIKQTLALNATINILSLSGATAAFDVK